MQNVYLRIVSNSETNFVVDFVMDMYFFEISDLL